MLKIFRLLFVALALPFAAISQQTVTLSGVVTDSENQPLPAASVVLTPGNYGTVTDKNGNFVFGNLPAGDYTLRVIYLGYKNYSESFKLNKNITVKIALQPLLMTLDEITITDNYAEQRKNSESVNIEIVNEKYLKQNLGGSLMKSLDRLPGISTIDVGAGQSKPVIRGMSFNRVVVTENGPSTARSRPRAIPGQCRRAGITAVRLPGCRGRVAVPTAEADDRSAPFGRGHCAG